MDEQLGVGVELEQKRYKLGDAKAGKLKIRGGGVMVKHRLTIWFLPQFKPLCCKNIGNKATCVGYDVKILMSDSLRKIHMPNQAF